MRPCAAPLVAALLAALVIRAPAATQFFPVADIRPGLDGTGLTVFAGTTLEEFRVRFIGVLENVLGPKRNLILARLEGGPLAETGVIAGMSGSPVYVDGRLVGAVSYALGPFVKETIAGITPIGEMIDATESPTTNVRRVAALELANMGALPAALRAALGGGFLVPANPPGLRAVGLSDDVARDYSLNLRPIATPLGLRGFSDSIQGLLTEALGPAGFAPQLTGQDVGSSAQGSTSIKPGEAIGVSLVRGDLALGATGTVTHVDGNRVYAFGHPLFSLGPVSLPLTRASVLTVLPSLMTSVKIASLGTVVGTLQQDRATAIAGTLGASAPMMPVTLALNADRGPTRTFKYEVIKDQTLTPLITLVSLLSTLQSYERQVGAATFTVRGQARVHGQASVSFEDVFTGEPPSLGAATYVVAPLSALLQNDRAPVDIDAVDLTITSSEQPRTATLERAWVDATSITAGATVPLKIALRTYRGDVAIRTVSIGIPPTLHGPATLVVSDGARLAQTEPRDLRRPAQSQSLPQLIRLLNNARRNSRLYVRLVAADQGAIVHGEALPALPSSVLDVLESDRAGGSFTVLANATLGEWEVPFDVMVSGSRTLNLTVAP